MSPSRTRATRLGPTLRMAILTTACGLAGVAVRRLPGPGAIGDADDGEGILTAGAMTYWVPPLWIPAAMVRVPEALDRGRGLTVAAAERRARWEPPRAGDPGGRVFLNRPWFDDDVASMNPLRLGRSSKRDRELREALGAPDVRYLLSWSAASRRRTYFSMRKLCARNCNAGWQAARSADLDLVTDFCPAAWPRRQSAKRRCLPVSSCDRT